MRIKAKTIEKIGIGLGTIGSILIITGAIFDHSMTRFGQFPFWAGLILWGIPQIRHLAKK